MRILLADDHAMFRSGLRGILESHFSGATIEEASSCNEVLDCLREGACTIAILDIAMGVHNSLNILPDIRKLYPEMPVLILSMYNDKQFIVQALRAGASGYITKEHTPDELVRAIQAILKGGKYVSESVAANLVDYLALGGCEYPHELLSARESEVLRLIASGRSVSEIASSLSLSVKTISTYRTRILEKMDMRSNAELMRYALKHGLVQ
ncbi:MAG: response regulator transcription factor [Candidatus Obscuribacterales bacterium]|nr:response regulator transcription factor [Candidatus Obscuribacterales bacterium]